jgi:hypothetical protein
MNLEKGDSKMKYEAPCAAVVNFKSEYVMADSSGGYMDITNMDNDGRGGENNNTYSSDTSMIQ